jgi:hypothetical protein
MLDWVEVPQDDPCIHIKVLELKDVIIVFSGYYKDPNRTMPIHEAITPVTKRSKTPYTKLNKNKSK